MRKIKDKTNILMIVQSVARQLFAYSVLSNGNKVQIDKRIKTLKQSFDKNRELKKQLRLRRLIESMSIKDKQSRNKIIESVINVSRKIDNSKIKKKLVQKLNVNEQYWIKPNMLQQSIGNMLNNSKYYGMKFYKQEQEVVRQTLKQSFLTKKQQINDKQNIEQLCQNFNRKYQQLPQKNKQLVKTFLNGNNIEQKKVMNQVSEYKQKLSDDGKKKLDYILQNTSKLDKFDKVFLLTSILQDIE